MHAQKHMNMKDSGEYCAGSLGVRKGSWTQEEDGLLRNCVLRYGEGSWHQVPTRAGLNRCRKSCRLRWLNYLKPNIKRGLFTDDEVDLLIRLHKLLGNRWSLIAGRLPGRTGNDVKNYWNTHLRKRMLMKKKKKKKKNGNEDDDDDDDEEVIKVGHGRDEVIRPRPRKLAPGSWRPPVQLQSSHVAQPAATDNDDVDWWETVLLQQQQEPVLLDPEPNTTTNYYNNHNSNFQGLIFTHHNKYNSSSSTTANIHNDNHNDTRIGEVGDDGDDDEGDQAVEESGCGFYFDHDDLHLWNF